MLGRHCANPTSSKLWHVTQSMQGPIKFKPDGARPEDVMRLRQHRIKKQGCMLTSYLFGNKYYYYDRIIIVNHLGIQLIIK